MSVVDAVEVSDGEILDSFGVMRFLSAQGEEHHGEGSSVECFEGLALWSASRGCSACVRAILAIFSKMPSVLCPPSRNLRIDDTPSYMLEDRRLLLRALITQIPETRNADNETLHSLCHFFLCIRKIRS